VQNEAKALFGELWQNPDNWLTIVMRRLLPCSILSIGYRILHFNFQNPASGITFVSVLFIFLAAASAPVAGSISLKFEDSSMDMESLADNPATLLPLHAVALYYKIDYQWDPSLEQVMLARNSTEIKIVLGNRHALIMAARGHAPLLRHLSEPPTILQSRVVLPAQDTACILSDLFPSMDVSWDKAKATIEVKKRNTASVPATNASSVPPLTRSKQNEGAGRFELRRIVIDPGHGGRDPGAVKGSTWEKKIVLDIALRLKKLIESKSNWEVVLTRDTDKFITLKRRTEIAAQYPADSTLFISIHCNAGRSSRGRGLETFVFNIEATDAEAAALAKRENAEAKMDLAYILSHCYHVGTEPYSLEAANKIQASLVKRLRLRNRGVKRAPFYVLAGTKMPAILVELAFISNYYDRKKLRSASFRQSAAEALLEAIKDFDRAAGKLLAKAG
jgi:N-acetylmuramoyl-L-alanine amidase